MTYRPLTVLTHYNGNSGNQAVNQTCPPLKTSQEHLGSPLEPECYGWLPLKLMQNGFHTFTLFHRERQIDDNGFGWCRRRWQWSLLHCHPMINAVLYSVGFSWNLFTCMWAERQAHVSMRESLKSSVWRQICQRLERAEFIVASNQLPCPRYPWQLKE